MTCKYAGQIVRIKLENFMSYDSIEIYPGNHLNLIIGPNGTGKSSIVCAVLLGLGGKLKTLGRADQLSSYIKSGCKKCCIEIELFDPEKNNFIIKRKISSSNQSEFVVNGKVSNVSKVNEIRKIYNIQIDNLCTFLPQEKVQDFSKLNPQQLLDQTQRTVGHINLVQLHEELKTLQSKTIEQERNSQILKDELENEKQKNDRLKDKIKSFKEKQSLCEKLVLLNQKKAWLCYEEECQRKKEIDKDFKLAESIYNTKKQEIEKLNRQLQQLESGLSAYQKRLTEAKKNEAGKKEVLEEWVKRGERKMDSLEDLNHMVQLKLNEEEEKKKDMLRHKGNVEKLTNDLENLDSTIGSESEILIKKEEADRELKDIHTEETRLNRLKVELVEDEDTLNQDIRNVSRECELLKKRRYIRFEYLKRHEPDVYKSIEWLNQNRHLFHSKIYNPMLLELDVPNSRMAKYVESLVRYRDLISFTCTNPDDLNILIRKLRTEQKLKVNAICSDEYDSSQHFPDIPIQDLRPYGFHSYVKDLISGPEDIIRFLCKTYRIHCVPVGDENVKSNCGKVPKNITLFYSENDVFSVKYSVYSGDKSITVKKLDDPRYFIESLDEGRIKVLTDRHAELQNKVRKKQAEIKQIDEQVNKLRETLEEVKKRRRQLATGELQRQQIQGDLNRALDNYKSIKQTLRNPDDIEKEADEQRQSLKKDIQKNFEDLREASKNFVATKLSRQTSELQYKINTFEKNQVLENKSLCSEELSRKEVILRDMKERQRNAELKCLQLKEKAIELTENISRGERGFQKYEKKFAELPNTLDEIETAIAETQTKADFLQGGNYQILQEYEKREETINHLTKSLENAMKSLEQKNIELAAKQNEWLTPVNELVSNINSNFERFFEAMGCAGEVSLVCGENKNDLDQYGIKILVKFRDGMPLQELGRYFQSGGERAVATAIFMLSLQELTSVPFRFVDEINQGMDPENERRILQLIIRVTASERSTQYFFITPKLLPGLECSNAMTTLCIYNGPCAISATEWNLKKFLGKKNDLEKEDESETLF